MLIIGSYALYTERSWHVPPKDLDLIATFEELSRLTAVAHRLQHGVLSIPMGSNKTELYFPKGFYSKVFIKHVEVEIAWPGSTGDELLQNLDEVRGPKKARPLPGVEAFPAKLDVLYTIKMSHRYLKNSPHFDKTRTHIMAMRQMGAKIWDPEWLKRREDETYAYKHPNLNQKKAAFFSGDGIQYFFDHDSIHEAVAKWHFGIPAYKAYAGDGEVLSSKKKFFEQPAMTRLVGVLEEALVLALERSQIPYGQKRRAWRGEDGDMRILTPPPGLDFNGPAPYQSFSIALRKVCTSITSGWFREYAWENMDKVNQMYDDNYVDNFWKAVDDGLVKYHRS